MKAWICFPFGSFTPSHHIESASGVSQSLAVSKDGQYGCCNVWKDMIIIFCKLSKSEVASYGLIGEKRLHWL
jgi:hypothetical protein